MKRLAIVFTAFDIEYKAVRLDLTGLKEEEHRAGNVYERGTFISETGDWEIGIIQTTKGDVRAGIQAERAIAHFGAKIVIFLGVAGGIKDVNLGDVVVADKVYAYEAGKDGDVFLPRPEQGIPSFRIIERARAEARKSEWLRRNARSSALLRQG